MIGTLLNAAGIILGGLVGWRRRGPASAASEAYFKVLVSAFTVFYGLRLTWLSLSGPIGHGLKQLLITILALALGKITGRLLRLQQFSNRLGQRARERILSAQNHRPLDQSEGFKTCAALFCAAPLGILGSVQDGLSGYAWTLGVKAVIEGLAAMGFIRLFGWGVLLSALPVVALQGSITLVCAAWVGPFLEQHSAYEHSLIDSVNAVGGLLVFSAALVMLQLKRLELADYLPSLIVAPLLTRLIG